MIFLRSITRKHKEIASDQFPFNLSIIQTLKVINFTTDVTILVGENGSGKSTFMEGLACALNSIAVGETNLENDPSLIKARQLSDDFQLSFLEKTRKGFFMRAEDFFQYCKKMNTMKSDLENEMKIIDEKYKTRSKTAQLYARSGYSGQINAIESRYGNDLDSQSHGEAFIEFFKTRFIPGGLYLLDEPEAPLSPLRQISFLLLLKDMVKNNSQFIIATHSPILMAFPGARILSFDEAQIKEIKYDDISSVKTMKNFLNYPDSFLHYLEDHE